MSSEAQLANRRNSELSTGPKTEAGKAKSSLNAVRHGLTGRTVLLPSEDAAAYEAHLEAFQKRFSPATDEERNLVQSLADTEWRLLRIPSLEMGIYAVGRLLKQRDKALTELDRVQKLRARDTYAALSRVTDLYAQAKAENRVFQPTEFGFEFTTTQVEEQLQARKLGRGLQSAMSAGLLPRFAA